MTTIPSLSDVTDILDTDQVMVTNAQGQSYKIAGSELNKRGKIIIANSTTITGAPLKTGNCVRIYFTADITAANATTTMQIKYNNVNYYVKVPKNGALANFVANAVGNTYKYVQAYTTLELLYDGTNFVIIGNPVIISGTDFTIFADGLKRVDAVTDGDKSLVTSNAVADAMVKSDYLYDYTTLLDSPQWIKVCEFGKRNVGSTLELELFSSYYNTTNASHIIKITYGWTDAVIEDLAKDTGAAFDKVRICWADDNTTKLGLYVHYNKGTTNGVYCKIKGASVDIVKAYTPNADPTTFGNYKEFSLGTNGLYSNGELLDPVDYKCIHSIKVTYQQSRTIKFANWGFGLCMGNIEGAGNFAFDFSLSNGIFAVNNRSVGTAFQFAESNENVVTVGTVNYKFKMTFNSNNTITFDWSGINNNAVFGRIALFGMSANGL